MAVSRARNDETGGVAKGYNILGHKMTGTDIRVALFIALTFAGYAMLIGGCNSQNFRLALAGAATEVTGLLLLVGQCEYNTSKARKAHETEQRELLGDFEMQKMPKEPEAKAAG